VKFPSVSWFGNQLPFLSTIQLNKTNSCQKLSEALLFERQQGGLIVLF